MLLDPDTGLYLDEVVWYLAVNRISTESDVDNSSSRIYFKITLADICHDLPLDDSDFFGGTNTELDVILFSRWSLPQTSSGADLIAD